MVKLPCLGAPALTLVSSYRLMLRACLLNVLLAALDPVKSQVYVYQDEDILRQKRHEGKSDGRAEDGIPSTGKLGKELLQKAVHAANSNQRDCECRAEEVLRRKGKLASLFRPRVPLQIRGDAPCDPRMIACSLPDKTV